MRSPYYVPIVLWLGLAVVVAVEWWGQRPTEGQRQVDRLARRDRRRARG
jgi:hypothetical protein